MHDSSPLDAIGRAAFELSHSRYPKHRAEVARHSTRSAAHAALMVLMTVETRVFLGIDAFRRISGMGFAAKVDLLIPLAKQVLDSQCLAFRDSVIGRRAMSWRPRFHSLKRALWPPELRGFWPPLTNGRPQFGHGTRSAFNAVSAVCLSGG